MKQLLFILFSLAYSFIFAQQPWLEGKSINIDTLSLEKEKEIFDRFWESPEGKQLEQQVGKKPGYKQFMRKYYRFQNYGKISPEERLKHKNFILSNNINQRSLSCKSWEFIGPKIYPPVIPSSNLAYTFPAGKGVVRSIDYSRQNNNILYAGCELGGFWKSTDFGVHWTEVSQSYFHDDDITDIQVNPFNDNQIFARADNKWYYSNDGGFTWLLVTLNGSSTANTVLKYSNQYTGIVIAINSSGVFKSINGGSNWVNISSMPLRGIQFNPLNNNVIYSLKTAGTEVVRSDNMGVSWYSVSTGLPIASAYNKTRLEVTPADTSVLYVFTANSNFTGLYKSGNGGQSWTLQLSSSNMLNGQGTWSCAFAVSPNNPNVLFAGGLRLHKSVDGGLTFTPVSDWVYSFTPAYNSNYCHADIQSLKFINNSDSLLITNDGGVYFSSDLGTTYSDFSADINISEVWGLDISYSDTNFYCIGSWHNGSNHFGRNFTKIDGAGDGFGSQVHPTLKRFYNSSQLGSIIKNWYWGTNNFSVSAAAPPVPISFYYTKFKLDKKTPNILYTYYANGIYKSVNEGANYTQIFNYTLADLELYDQNGNYFYGISDNTALSGKLLKSSNGGNTINQISLPVGMNDAVFKVDVHPFDSNQVILMRKWQFVNYNGAAVFKSNDGGNTWIDLTKNLPPAPVYDVAFDTTAVGDIYLATDGDVLYTNSTMNGWLSAANGWPQIPTFEMILDWKNRRLVAGTWGRGVWELSLKNSLSKQTNYFTLCPGEDTLIGNLYINIPGTFHDTIQNSIGCDSLINEYVVSWDLPVNCSPGGILATEKLDFSLEQIEEDYYINAKENKVNYSFYSIGGKLIKEGTVSSHERDKILSLDNYAKGVYILMLQTKESKKSYKIKN